MRYRELIKRVQDYSGISDQESRDALEVMVEMLAVRLADRERRDFASQLPEQLQDIALTVWPTEDNYRQSIIEQAMELQDIDESSAKRRLRAAWHALCDAISSGEVEDIESQLPNDVVAMLSY